MHLYVHALVSENINNRLLNLKLYLNTFLINIFNYFFNPSCSGEEGKFALYLSYFNTAPKLNKGFALMHPDYESNSITHIFRKFWVSRATGSDVIFDFVKDT